MNTIALIPRFISLTLTFIFGPCALLVSIIKYGFPDFIAYLIPTGFLSGLFILFKTTNFLKPSPTLVNKLNEVNSTIYRIPSKAPVLLEKIRETHEAASTRINTEIEKNNERSAKVKEFAKNRKTFIDAAILKSKFNPIEIIVLGGSGWEMYQKKKFLLSMEGAFICMSNLEKLEETKIRAEELQKIEIGGPGKVTQGGGFIGGGSGPGMIGGMLIAATLNAITSSTTIKTEIYLRFRDSEIIVLSSKLEPSEARLILSPLYLTIGDGKPPTSRSTILDDLERLQKMKAEGAISQEQYEILKEKFINKDII